MSYPVRDAYLNASSLEAASPQAALRVNRRDEPEPRELRLERMGQETGNRMEQETGDR